MGRGRTGGALAAADDVATDDEVAIGVDGLARAHDALPPPGADVAVTARSEHAAAAAPGRAHPAGVRRVGGEGASRLVGHRDVAEAAAALEHEVSVGGHPEELPPAGRVAGVPGAGDRRRRPHVGGSSLTSFTSVTRPGCAPWEAF